jgi:hypothetical protein
MISHSRPATSPNRVGAGGRYVGVQPVHGVAGWLPARPKQRRHRQTTAPVTQPEHDKHCHGYEDRWQSAPHSQRLPSSDLLPRRSRTSGCRSAQLFVQGEQLFADSESLPVALTCAIRANPGWVSMRHDAPGWHLYRSRSRPIPVTGHPGPVCQPPEASRWRSCSARPTTPHRWRAVPGHRFGFLLPAGLIALLMRAELAGDSLPRRGRKTAAAAQRRWGCMPTAVGSFGRPVVADGPRRPVHDPWLLTARRRARRSSLRHRQPCPPDQPVEATGSHHRAMSVERAITSHGRGLPARER